MATANNINNIGADTGSPTASHWGDLTGDPFSAPSAAYTGDTRDLVGDDDHHEAEVEAIPWLMVADRLGYEPDDEIAKCLSPKHWEAVRTFARRHGVPIVASNDVTEREGTRFEDLDHAPLPAHLAELLCPELEEVTRTEVLEFINDEVLYDISDPEPALAKLIEAADERRRERSQQHQALKSVEVAPGEVVTIPPDTEYALAEVERQCGAEVADAARLMIERCNRRAWSHPKPHNFHEHTYLMKAGELVSLGVAAADIAAMSAATADDRDTALEKLGIARQRHRDDIVRQARGADLVPLALDEGVLSFAQLSQLEPVTPLIDGLLAKGELAELIGEPGTAKTFIALGMALSIAAGRGWCGHKVPRPASVLYVLAEGTSDIEVRAKAFCERHKVSADDLGTRFHLFPRPVQIADEGHISEVRAYVAAHGIDMVVFDTKARCTVGVEENSATDQGRAIANVETVNHTCGATVLLVHHTAKGSDTARGSTAWLGAVWSSLLVTRPTKDKKKSSAVAITCAKHKGWPDGCVHKFSLTAVTVSEDAMPGKTAAQRTSLVVEPLDAMAEAAEWAKLDSEIGVKITAVFHSYGAATGLTKAEARKHARAEGVSDSSFSRYFDKFVKTEVLLPMPGATAHYRLATDAAVSTVGTEQNQALVDALKDRMCGLRNDGQITDAHGRSDVFNMLSGPDKTAFGQAWGWFEDQGRPTART